MSWTDTLIIAAMAFSTGTCTGAFAMGVLMGGKLNDPENRK